MFFSPTPLFSGPDYPMASFKFLACRGNEFWDETDYKWPAWKIIAPCLHLPPSYTQLLGYIAWQWDRYLISQNVLLVSKLKS